MKAVFVEIDITLLTIIIRITNFTKITSVILNITILKIEVSHKKIEDDIENSKGEKGKEK